MAVKLVNVSKKLYVGIVRDHSGSMDWLSKAAMEDYNSLITTIRNASDQQDVDTIVSTVKCGVGVSGSNEREVINSSVLRLKPLTTYRADGSYTPLFDAVADVIDLLEKVPDAKDENVSFLVLVVTDGEDNRSVKWDGRMLGDRITRLQNGGNWTVTFRVPLSKKQRLTQHNIPAGNIMEWNVTDRNDFERSSRITQASVSNYFGGLSRGVRSTNSFYADAANVSASQVRSRMTNISSEVNIYGVSQADTGCGYGTKVEIADFIERKTLNPYIRGSAFYELVKTEKAVQASKIIAVRNKNSGAIYAGQSARDLLGLPNVGTIKLSPGDHGQWDIFIQSTSSNRILPVGSRVLYWKAAGR